MATTMKILNIMAITRVITGPILTVFTRVILLASILPVMPAIIRAISQVISQLIRGTRGQDRSPLNRKGVRHERGVPILAQRH